MSILLDIVLLILLILFLVSGFRRGVAKSITEFGGALLAIVVAALLAALFAPMAYNTFVQGPLVDRIHQTLQGSVGTDAVQKLQEFIDALPGFLGNALESYGLSAGKLNEAVAGSTGEAANAVAALLAPVITDLLRLAMMLVFFIILMIVVKLAARGVDWVFDLPILRQLNSLLGAAFGVLKCAVVVIVLCTVLQIIIPMMNPVPEIFQQSTIDSTILFKFLYNNNPLYHLFELI